MRDVEVATQAYRRRILVVGVVLAAMLAAVGAPWYLRSVETDLQRRVPAHLDTLGFEGVQATFTGQSGTLRCRSPLVDPERVLDAAHEVRGVRAVRLDRSCRVSAAPTIATTVPGPTDSSAETDPTTPADPDPDDDVIPPAFDSIADLVGSDPQFSLLAALAVESDTAHLFADDGPITVFAPSDAAFEELPADVLAELRQRPDQLAEVIRHHVVDGRLAAAELVSGPLDALDGTQLDVIADGRVVGDPSRLLGTFQVDGAEIVAVDLTARNGVVHVIDRVLLPDDLQLAALAPRPVVQASFSDGQIVLTGTVASGAARSLLLDAAGQAVEADNVVDELVEDELSEAGPGEMVPMATVLPSAVLELASGSVGLVEGVVVVRGLAVSDEASARLADVISTVGGVAELDARPVASEDDVDGLATALAEVLAEQPLRFSPGGSELEPESASALDRIAGLVKRFDGATVEIGGYTDTAGSAVVNQALSEERAGAVLFELVARGVPFDQLVAVGYGSAAPILVGGVEDPEASRRVELVPSLVEPDGDGET